MRRVVASPVLTMALLGLLGSVVQAGQLPPDVVRLYRPAVERLRDAYRRISVEGTSRLVLPQERKSREQQFVLRIDDKLRRLDTTTLRQERMGLTAGARTMQMATPWGSLNTYTQAASEVFGNARQRDYGAVAAQIDRDSLLTMPFALDGDATILAMLLGPSVEVSAVKKTAVDGAEAVRIDYVQTARHAGRSGDWRSVVVLAPSQSWALVSFTRRLGEGSDQVVQQGRLSYAGQHDGIPKVQRISRETVVSGKVVRQEAIDVSRVDFGRPDRFYFDSFSF